VIESGDFLEQHENKIVRQNSWRLLAKSGLSCSKEPETPVHLRDYMCMLMLRFQWTIIVL